MAIPVRRRIFLHYSGDAAYLEYFIAELQEQLKKSRTIDVHGHRCTAEVKVELNLPGCYLECEVD